MKITRILGAAAVAAVAASSAAPALAASHAGGTLVIATTQVARHLNGAVQSGTATAVPSTQIFASPLRYDDGWTPQPYLAKSWEVSEDGLTVTLDLVEGATFHDGTPITSEDVAFSIMTTKENHPFKSMFEPVEDIDYSDPTKAVIKLSKPHPALLLAMSPALAPVMPKHIYGDGQDVKSHPRNSENPVGSGPFMVESYTQGESIVLKKNPDFFLDGKPLLDEIIIRAIKDENSLLIAMEGGEVDMYPFMASSTSIGRIQEAEGLGVTNQGYDAVGPINWLAFNTKSEKLSDVRVRQAIAYATDRNFIIKALHRGFSGTQRSPIIESSPFFDETIAAYDVDLDKAKALMEEAGFGDGMTLTVDFIPGPAEQQKNVGEYLKSQLKKIGIEIEVRAAPDFPTWAKRVSSYDFELTMDIVFNWGDPVIGVHRTYLCSNIVEGVIWSNTQQYCNEKVDEILNAAAVETDQEKRAALYAEFQQIVAADLPIYWINSLPYHTGYNEHLGGLPTSIWGPMHPLDSVFWETPKE